VTAHFPEVRVPIVFSGCFALYSGEDIYPSSFAHLSNYTTQNSFAPCTGHTTSRKSKGRAGPWWATKTEKKRKKKKNSAESFLIQEAFIG
jgi:hypothetical protein